MEKRNRTVQTGIWSVLVGGAVGFTLGMLFAPRRGPVMRRRLAYQLEQIAAQTEDVFRQVLESGPDPAPGESGEELVADAQARADHIRDDIDELLEELRKQSTADSKDAGAE